MIYESRLELSRLLVADFDRSVRRIKAQPFPLEANVAGRRCRHVPDYLLLTDEGPVVVDVKPAARLSCPAVAFTFGWTRVAVESKGWVYEVASEPGEVELANTRFLAGYRRDWLFEGELLDELRSVVLDGDTLGTSLRCLPARPQPAVRSAILHLLWRQH